MTRLIDPEPSPTSGKLLHLVCSCRLELLQANDFLLDLANAQLEPLALFTMALAGHRGVRLIWAWRCPLHGALNLELHWQPT